jgi:hypothetical protein
MIDMREILSTCPSGWTLRMVEYYKRHGEFDLDTICQYNWSKKVNLVNMCIQYLLIMVCSHERID